MEVRGRGFFVLKGVWIYIIRRKGGPAGSEFEEMSSEVTSIIVLIALKALKQIIEFTNLSSHLSASSPSQDAHLHRDHRHSLGPH